MNRWLKSLTGLRLAKLLFAGLAAIAFFAIPVVTTSAQAATLIATAPPDRASPSEVKRIQREAEDFGGENIGDTGLKNIRNLPNNIPETTDLIMRQRFGDEEGNLPNPQAAAEKAGEKVKEGAYKTKRAIEDAAS